MSIETPMANVELPKELANAIERARNVVTINESEAARLGELIVSREYSIREQQKQIFELDGEIEKKKLIAKGIEKEIESMNNQLLISTNARMVVENEYNTMHGSLVSLRDFLNKL